MRELISTIAATPYRLAAFNWLFSLSFGINTLTILLISLILKLLSLYIPKRKTPFKTWETYIRYYYVRGLLFLRLLYFGAVAAIVFRKLLLKPDKGQSAVKQQDLIFPNEKAVSLIELIANSACYYANVIAYEYSLPLLLSFTLETIIQVIGSHPLIYIIYDISLLLSAYSFFKSEMNQVFGKSKYLLLLLILLPGISYSYKLFNMLNG